MNEHQITELALKPSNPSLLLPEFTFSITDDAQTTKEQALLAAKKITAISTPEEMEAVNPVLRLIKNTLKFMEDSREAVKGPIIKIGKDIEGIAQGYSVDLETEEDRLKGLVADYLYKQQKQQVKEVKETGEVKTFASAGEGVSAVSVWKFEITDLALAYKENPGLFELIPKAAAILGGAKLGVPMPGIKTWQETSVRVKA